jgi:hypothetical protein
MDPQTMNAAFKTMVEQNPNFTQIYSLEQMQTLVQQGIKVMAFDFSTAGRTNLNVLQQPLPSEMSAGVFSQLAASQVEVQLKIAPPTIEVATVGGLDARLISYELALQTPNGTYNAAFSQYIVMNGRVAYIITFTNGTEDAAKNRLLFAQIAANFAFLP